MLGRRAVVTRPNCFTPPDAPCMVPWMSTEPDGTEFVDRDLEVLRAAAPPPAPATPASPAPAALPAPTRDEVDARMAEAQQKMATLKRAQEELERERAALEETRRRLMELKTGREEVVQSLIRGLGLLEEAEFNTRRDAEQMTKALVDLRDALSKVQAINQESWTQESFNVDLTRALTTLEHARMEWNSARVKFRVLTGEGGPDGAGLTPRGEFPPRSLFAAYSISDWCRLGLALTGPLALVGVLALVLLAVLLLRR